MWHQPCQRCKYNTSVDIQKPAIEKLVTHIESHASAVGLIENGEEHYIKAINSQEPAVSNGPSVPLAVRVSHSKITCIMQITCYGSCEVACCVVISVTLVDEDVVKVDDAAVTDVVVVLRVVVKIRVERHHLAPLT